MGVSQHVSILSTRINIFATGQHIWFGTQLSCMVADQVVEPREVLQPMDLATHELLGGCKVLKVLVIGEHEYDMSRAFQVVTPLSEGLKDGEQLFVVDLIVELSRLHAVGVECDWVDVAIIGGDLRDDRSDHIVRSVSFNNNGVIRVEMCQDGCLCKCCLEHFERLSVIGAPGEWGVLAGEAN